MKLQIRMMFVLGMLGTTLWAADQPVLVNNPRTQPVPVIQGPGMQPYQISGSAVFGKPDAGSGHVNTLGYASLTIKIPAGKRLVIESVTVRCSVDADDSCGVTLDIHPEVEVLTHYIQATPRIVLMDFIALFDATQMVRAYVDAPQTYRMTFSRMKSSANRWGAFSVSGYLVDLPLIQIPTGNPTVN